MRKTVIIGTVLSISGATVIREVFLRNRKQQTELRQAEVIYRISVLRNGPYILVIRYKDQGPGLSKEIVDSRAADKMKRLPGIL